MPWKAKHPMYVIDKPITGALDRPFLKMGARVKVVEPEAGRWTRVVQPFALEQLGALSARLFRLESEAAQLSKKIGVLKSDSSPPAGRAPAREPPTQPLPTGASGGPPLPARTSRVWAQKQHFITAGTDRSERRPEAACAHRRRRPRRAERPARPHRVADHDRRQRRGPAVARADAPADAAADRRCRADVVVRQPHRSVRPHARVPPRDRFRGAPRHPDRIGGRWHRRLCRIPPRLRLGRRDRPRQRPVDTLCARLRAARPRRRDRRSG